MWAQIKAAKWAIVAGLWLATFAAGLFFGFQWSRASSASRERDQLAKQVDEILAEQAQDRKRAERLQKTLDRMPRPSNKIREVVRDNPSGCVLPPAVVDGVLHAIREGNAVRKMP
jgi:septal ring factor EnvC (AmiA/AmiB activator)